MSVSITSSPTLIGSPHFAHGRDIEVHNDDHFTHNDSMSARSAMKGLRLLYSQIATSALYDPAERYDAPKCHPETRKAVIDDITSWIRAPPSPPPAAAADPPSPLSSVYANNVLLLETCILWLSGPAGAGKSSIMQAIAGWCSRRHLLAASFFFPHEPGPGSLDSRLVPTIAHQLVQTVPGIAEFVNRAVEKDPSIFSKSPNVQMEKLVLEPLDQASSRIVRGRDDDYPSHHHGHGSSSTSSGSSNSSSSSSSSTALWPKVILIDGLDECKGEERQLEMLSMLRKAAIDKRLPFRLLLASRPQPGLARRFSSPELASLSHQIALEERYDAPGADIRLFLACKLSEVGRRRGVPRALRWPSPADVDQLVYNASGQFVYAATAVRFIDGGAGAEVESFGPVERLKMVLQVKFTKTYRDPLASLDALYSAILGRMPDPMRAVRYLREVNELLTSGVELTLPRAEFFFSFNGRQRRSGRGVDGNSSDDEDGCGLEGKLGELRSVIYIPERAPKLGRRPGRAEQMWFFHKSFIDYLQDPARSQGLYVPRTRVHTDLAVHYLRAATTHQESEPLDADYDATDDAASMLSQLHLGKFCSFSAPHDPVLREELARFDVELWLFYAAGFEGMRADVEAMYQWVHVECPWSGCTPACRRWRRAILRFWDKLGCTSPTVLDKIWDKFTPRDMKRVKLITSRYRL